MIVADPMTFAFVIGPSTLEVTLQTVALVSHGQPVCFDVLVTLELTIVIGPTTAISHSLTLGGWYDPARTV